MNGESRNIFVRTKREMGAHSRELEEENVCTEGEGKVKTKLMSMWNNMKYGKFTFLSL
jgi:hypothetical protein